MVPLGRALWPDIVGEATSLQYRCAVHYEHFVLDYLLDVLWWNVKWWHCLNVACTPLGRLLQRFPAYLLLAQAKVHPLLMLHPLANH